MLWCNPEAYLIFMGRDMKPKVSINWCVQQVTWALIVLR